MEDHSSTTVDRYAFVLVTLDTEDGIAQGHAHDNRDDHVAIVCHYQHHAQNLHDAID